MSISLQAACRVLEDQCEIVRREAHQIAIGRTDDPDDVGAMLYHAEDLEAAIKQAQGPARERCKKASK